MGKNGVGGMCKIISKSVWCNGIKWLGIEYRGKRRGYKSFQSYDKIKE